MNRWIPHPWAVLGLTLIWMMLNSFSLGHLLLGAAIALVAGWALGAVEPRSAVMRRPWPFIRLMGIVSIDIIRSNIAVASLILSRDRGGQRHSGFVEIPLRLRDPLPLAILACILTATPGTAWVEYDSDSGVLLLHVFDLIDPEEWKAIVRDRYESLLLESFS